MAPKGLLSVYWNIVNVSDFICAKSKRGAVKNIVNYLLWMPALQT